MGPLVVYLDKNECGLPRLGMVVSRKVGSAVVRNRWKRNLREAFRLEKHNLPQDADLVVVPRQAEVAHVEELRKTLRATTKRLRKRV